MTKEQYKENHRKVLCNSYASFVRQITFKQTQDTYRMFKVSENDSFYDLRGSCVYFGQPRMDKKSRNK